jgi:hypothetical protein
MNLIRRSGTELTKTADGLRIAVRSDPGTESELRKLAAIENECCPWAAWTVETVAGAAVLEVRSAGEGIAVLHGMFSPDSHPGGSCPSASGP